jgi:branched-chain amino acid transport system ATP-binding protein
MAAPIPVTNSSPVVLSLSQVSVVAEDAVLLKPISLELRKGERLGVRGVNGAGKSTLLRAITGEKSICEGGAIVYGGQNITHASVVERAKIGITRSYQSPALFDQMSVVEHVMASIVSREHRFKSNPSGHVLAEGPSCPRSDLRAAWQAEAMDWLNKVDMTAMANGAVEQLSYAHQRILECVMTAAFAPSLALLDEPTAGMNPAERLAMCRMIDVLFAHSSLILVEHDPDVLESLCHRVIEITPC